MELIDVEFVTWSACANLVVDPGVEDLTGPLTSTRAAVMSLTAKLSSLGDTCDKAKREHDDLVMKI